MLGIYNNRNPFYNKSMMDYCRKSTEQSIQKIVEREKEKEKQKPKPKIELNLDNSQVISNNNSGITFFAILSVSSFIYYFLNTKK